jgi:phospholipase A1
LTPHRRNYLIPLVYNSSPNKSVYKGTGAEQNDLDKAETKFQVSLKYKLIDDIFGRNIDFYIAYTNLSYWQAYNNELSSAFRDTNHEPEAWLQFNTNWDLLGIKSKVIQAGAWHQSNGKGEPLSRSWNRLYANFIFEKDNLVFGIKPWYRLPESDADDDNPDIEKYYGYGELSGFYTWDEHNLSFMLRNNLRSSENKGAIELGWTFPLYKKLKGYVQYFNGYGQSILDYNSAANTIGIGLALSDLY